MCQLDPHVWDLCPLSCGSCLPLREHRCGGTSGLDMITDVVDQAQLDRNTLVRLLELVEADCGLCILETFEHVGGQGCVTAHLHIATSFVIEPWPCLPQLAHALATAQATALRNLARSTAPFGVTAAPWTNVTDLYVPSGERMNNAPVYRGVHHRDTLLYRCQGDLADGEAIWAVTRAEDRDLWSHCEGRLWISMETSQIRTHATDESKTAGGAYFGYGMEQCSQFLTTELSRASIFESNDSNGSSTVLTFAEGVSEMEVACTLLWKYGVYAPPHQAPATVQLPSGIGSIELQGDVAVHSGGNLMLHGAEGCTFVVAGRQLRVAQAGQLTLQGITLKGSTDGPAVLIEGDFRAVNCTFTNSVATKNYIVLPLEGGLQGERLTLSSIGGVMVIFRPKSVCTLVACTLVGNFVRGSPSASFGGAIWANGARLTLKGTQVRQNGAAGALACGGGAVAGSNADIDILDSDFTANEAGRPYEGVDAPLAESFLAAGAAIYVAASRLTVRSSRFTANVVRDASYQSTAGAIFLHEATVAVVSDSWFLANQATSEGMRVYGGAIAVAPFAAMNISTSIFEGNVVTSISDCRGGGLSVAGTVVLQAGVIFRSNAALGPGRALGGAVDVNLRGVFTTVEPTLFLNNTVRAVDPILP